MGKRFLLFLCILFAFSPPLSFAQGVSVQTKPTYHKGKVLRIEKEGTQKLPSGQENPFQAVAIQITDGTDKGKAITLTYGGTTILSPSQKLRTGESVILAKGVDAENKPIYSIADKERLPTLFLIILGFFALTAFMAGRKGIGAILGLIISIGVIVGFIVPQIIAGNDPLFISIVGSLVILVTTMFLAHGFTQKTVIAVASTAISLFLTGIIAYFFVVVTRLSGLGSEDIYTLQQGFPGINFQGLLLGGIIIGSLGVLDDVTTTQTATVFALAEADKKLTPLELFTRGMQVGREHITSVVNTLVLAYAGASIGVFIFLQLALSTQAQPLWVILNSEVLTEEVVRSLAGSVGLILAVPLTTILAALFSRYSISVK